jgi:hypothetical protein
MAILANIDKQPREIIDFDISYAKLLLGRTDTLTTSVSEVTPTGLTLNSTTVSGQISKTVVSGGTSGTIYTVTVLTSTTAGLKYEDEVTITVEEVA